MLPFWAFLPVALYLYLVPLFQARRLAVPFSILLALSFFQAPSVLFAVVFGAVFYAIILIKDLLVIDRRSAYELLAFALAFLLLRAFYMRFNEGAAGAALIWSFIAAGALTLLLRSFIRCFRDDIVLHPRLSRAAYWLSFILFWQVLIVGLFLPLDFIYQAVGIFLVIILIVDLVPQYLTGDMSRNKMLAAATTVFALYAIALSSARWGL